MGANTYDSGRKHTKKEGVMKKEMSIRDFLMMPEIVDSLIGEVIKTMVNGNFVEPDDAVAGSERVLGEMNALERALYTLLYNCKKEHETMEERHDHKKCMSIGQRAASLRGMLWESVEKRFAAGIDNEEVGGTGVRKGFKIVTFPPQTSSVFMEILRASL
ncbi:MAG TPA: hypothetical protein PKZ16_01195 [bacterium]|nr:hypothetical protein [bacterium]HPL95498.1 hypothetical protein [bacterium]